MSRWDFDGYSLFLIAQEYDPDLLHKPFLSFSDLRWYERKKTPATLPPCRPLEMVNQFLAFPFLHLERLMGKALSVFTYRYESQAPKQEVIQRNK